MPEKGIPKISQDEILSHQELLRIVTIFAQLGITKVRITGGEPFARKDAVQILQDIRLVPYPLKLYITTNGILANNYFSEIESLNPDGINLSLDTLRSDRFFRITRKQGFNQTEIFLKRILQTAIPLKINFVVQPGINEDEVIAIAELAKDYPIEVRLIEKMPFGRSKDKISDYYTNEMIENLLFSHFRLVEAPSPENATARLFDVKGFKGKLGIIAGYSRLFCSSCNRIRITAAGNIKTCLYAKPSINLKLLLQSGYTDEQIKTKLINTVNNRHKDGFIAEQEANQKVYDSMAAIGG
jgi:cyclic pyranopterin phosphate synthase